jgi:RHS repeat-associated protein
MLNIRQEQMDTLPASVRAQCPQRFLEDLKAQGIDAKKEAESGDVVATDARGYQTRMAFQADGLPATLTKPSGLQYQFEHDAQGRLAAIIYPGGERVEMQRNAKGNITQLSRPELLAYHFQHDAEGRVQTVNYPDNTQISYTYETGNQPSAMTDRAGATYRYADNGHTITDPLGRRVVYDTDAQGALKTIHFPDGSKEEYAFDPDLNQAVIIARDGKPVALTSSEIKNDYGDKVTITNVAWSDNTFVKFEFDEPGNITVAKNHAQTITYSFDDKGHPLSAATGDETLSYNYDADGHLTELTTPAGDKIGYEYDEDGRITIIRDWEGRENKIVYAENGTLAQIQYGNGLVETQEYARVGRLKQARVTDSRGELCVQSYDYDLCERLTDISDTWGKQAEQHRHLEYDAESRVLAEIDTDTNQLLASFAYDVKGNMTQCDGAGITVGVMDEPLNYGAYQIDYDDLGNMVRLPSTHGDIHCTFSANGTLREAKISDRTIQFEYDAFGRRILKTDGQMTWHYGWSGNQLLWEDYQAHPNAAVIRRDYLYWPNSVTPIAFREAGQTYWLQTDARGAVIRAFDEKGTIVWHGIYDSFGKANIQVAEIRQPWRLMGHYHDDETGLHYNFARYYSPYLKSYLSQDPSWSKAGATNYSYARNDPWNRVDPFGYFAFLLAAAGAVVVGAAVGAAVEYFTGGDPVAGAVEGGIAGLGVALGALGGPVGMFVGGLIGSAAGAFAGSLVKQARNGDEVSIECGLAAAGTAALFDIALLGLGKIPGVKKVVKKIGSKLADAVAPLQKWARQGWGMAKRKVSELGKWVGERVDDLFAPMRPQLVPAGGPAIPNNIMESRMLPGGGGKKAGLSKTSDIITIPSVRNNEFNQWFDNLSSEQFDQIWSNPELRKKIQQRLRHPGGMHEWLLVSRADKFKKWGVTADEIKGLRTTIKDVKFKNPNGIHGGLGSTKAHNEILNIIDTASDYNDFKRRLRMWAHNRLEGGVDALPPGLID